jgi:hypothetical protein
MSDRLQAINANLKRAARSNSEQSSTPSGDEPTSGPNTQGNKQDNSGNGETTQNRKDAAQAQLEQHRAELAANKAAIAKRIGVAKSQTRDIQVTGETTNPKRRRKSKPKEIHKSEVVPKD